MNSTKQPLMRSGRLTAKGRNCCGALRGGRASEKREWMREQDLGERPPTIGPLSERSRRSNLVEQVNQHS